MNQETLALERIKEVRGEREDLDPSTLHLSPLTRNMSGEFVCQARNSVGTAEVNIILSVNCEYNYYLYLSLHHMHFTSLPLLTLFDSTASVTLSPLSFTPSLQKYPDSPAVRSANY